MGVAPEESSDDEVGSESPLDEIVSAPEFASGSGSVQGNGVFPPSSLSLRERRDSATRYSDYNIVCSFSL